MINVVASRYAEALFQIGEEENSIDLLYSELKAVVDIFDENQEFFNIMKSPVISKKEKIELIDKVFSKGLNSNSINFLKILIEKDRISFIADIAMSYKERLNEKNNVIEGTVITAIPMKQDEMQELAKELSKKYNKKVNLENIVDKSILGGVLVRLGNEEIDGTVKTRLSKVKEQLSQVIS